MKYFHATQLENVPSIWEDGLRLCLGEIYLTDTIDSAMRWAAMRMLGQESFEIAVVEVEIDETLVEEGTDHSPIVHTLFGVGPSFVTRQPIEAEQIIDIHHLSCSFNEQETEATS